MSRLHCLLCLLLIVRAAGAETFDPFDADRKMIRNGVQAVLMCNGLFTSHRTLEQVFEQELAYLFRFGGAVGTQAGGDYFVDYDRKGVGVGGGEAGTRIHAAFREGIGCVVMAPGQDLDDIDELPSAALPPPPGNPNEIPWPSGDRIAPAKLNPRVDESALQAVSDWAFHRESPEQVTLSLIVVHGGSIVHERYAEGVGPGTRTRTWSTAKSIAATLIGMLVDRGSLSLDAPVDIDWLPAVAGSDADPRRAITLRHLLNMSSGLYPVDSFGMEYVNGSGLAYWAGAGSAAEARKRGLIREPGTFWDYENYDTLLAVYAMKRAVRSTPGTRTGSR